MFGEYAIYYSGKVVALACDNRLFVKPTPGGLAFAGDIPMAPAYPGAKPSLLVDDQIDDGDWLVRLITITAQELPMPKPKKKKSLRDSVPR
ncbi:MAG: TfoX/Sxy family protein [Gammaproteobacteria bacterium]|nr:TfoX/Sxy family protein [Gammaproteobacteria bacterium]